MLTRTIPSAPIDSNTFTRHPAGGRSDSAAQRNQSQNRAVDPQQPPPKCGNSKSRSWSRQGQSYSTGAAESLDMVGAKPHGVLRSDVATIHADAASKKLRKVSDH
jgi:hypothetical protein